MVGDSTRVAMRAEVVEVEERCKSRVEYREMVRWCMDSRDVLEEDASCVRGAE